MLFQNKIVTNKFYKYADSFVKIKKLSKIKNKILVVDIKNMNEILIPYEGSDLLLHRVYTVGEVAKIVGRQPNTLRKYERKNLISSPKKFGDEYGGYKNWRYYDQQDVYEIVEFFNTRVQGRPIRNSSVTINTKIKTINQKVKLHR
jgi:hypothetical protein